ncbi:hypothetical protein B0F90DRAFT_1626504 [Multifurca ochricompacta]|uniref:Non-ribosomal peptide synthetase n=1 Tax=Multifurca ochricompacta TaxID=376703 RepID=A0AAD4M6H2_9AGAM|nr:hypothetical protein B0F90DRAFT_1626504 [Multifurca ochricompacta]
MSSVPAPEGASPAYDAAEKGTLDVHLGPTEITVMGLKDERKVDATLILSKEVVAPSKPAAVKTPAKKKVSKWILWTLWFNTYRKLFTFVFTINMVGIGLAASGHFPYAVHWTGAMALGNLNFAILMRNELFGRFLYLFVNTFFAKWTFLWWRLGCTSVLQHLGGIHSGCALSGVSWLILKVVNNFRHHSVNHDSILIVGTITNIVVIISALSAFPWVRNTHHNIFERHHRFVGWLGLILTWVFTILGDSYNPETRTWNLSGQHILRQQDFWFAMGMTTFIIIPWLCVREVPVDIELPSPKVAIVRFKRGMQQGLLGRISRTSIMEYHAFGIISEGTHAKYHYMICGVQGGDFTRSLVNDPPRTLWTRELKFAGVSNTSTLYKRGVRICTGTGIGAALSTCLQSPHWYLIWIGSDQEKTFGPTISGLIHRHIGPERLLLWDSKLRGGRPDTMKILKEAYYSWEAEVVFITSNYIGNSEIMQGCKEAGIPAFGTLWDFVGVTLYKSLFLLA